MQPLSLTTADLMSHVVNLGLDVYPPISIPPERTRLNVFYEEVRNRHPELFSRVVASDTEFVISKEFRGPDEGVAATTTVSTFALTGRGPVFAFPLLLAPPVGATKLESSYVELFWDLHAAFFSGVPGRGCLRLSVARELVFHTGQTPCHGLIARQPEFARAALVGGGSRREYRDSLYSHVIFLEPRALVRETTLPIGHTIEEPAGHGVRVVLEVSNDVLRALDEDDMQGVIDRANSLWPEMLLEYLNTEGEPR